MPSAMRQYVVSDRFGRYHDQGSSAGRVSYNGVAAMFLKNPIVYAPSPGSEANYGHVRGTSGTSHRTMKVLTKPFYAEVKREDGTKETVLAGGIENGHLKEFYDREFADTIEYNDLGYANYTKLTGESLPFPDFSTERSASWIDKDLGRMMRLPTGMIVTREYREDKEERKRYRFGFHRPEPHSDNNGVGHIYRVEGAAPLSFQTRQYPGSLQTALILTEDSEAKFAVFVTKTGKVLLYDEDDAGSLAPSTRTIPTPKVKYVYLRRWDVVSFGGKTEPGVLEEVNPQCYW